MKKAFSVPLIALLAATSMCGCSKSPTRAAVRISEPAEPQQPQVQTQQDEPNASENNRIEITIDGGKVRTKSALSGVRRHFRRDRSGKYTVEYIHAPYGIDKDETLDYNLTLNSDNTFEMTVVSDGVTANHSGRWYERRNNIMLFYDEQMDQQQHNIYVADSLFCDLLPKGKIMIYDNCYTIVLSQNNETTEQNQ